MITEAAFSDLSERVWSLVAERRDILTNEPITVPEMVPADTDGVGESRFSESFPALEHLEFALELAAQAGFGDVVDGFRAVLPGVRWSQNPAYTEETAGRALLDGYAYAAFTGPDAPVRCAAPRGGFMVMAPNVLYPPHEHAPREVYLVMTPGARWQLDNGDWFDVEPGDLILHRPWVTHAMRTTSRPMLVFAGWVEAGNRSSINWGATG